MLKRMRQKTRVKADVRTQVRAQMRTRLDVINGTVKQFMTVGDRHQNHSAGRHPDYELVNDKQLAAGFVIVAFKKRQIVSVIRLKIDWQRYQAMCSVRGEIDVGHDAVSDAPKSIEEMVSVADRYLSALKQKRPDLTIRLMWEGNQAAMKKHGLIGLLNRYMDCYGDVSSADRKINIAYQLFVMSTFGRLVDAHIARSLKKRAAELPEITEMSLEFLH